MKGLCSQSNLTELEPGWALHRPSDKPDIYLQLKVRNGFVIRAIHWKLNSPSPSFDLSFLPLTLTFQDAPVELSENQIEHLHGDAKIWHPNGQLKASAFYRYGKLDGLFSRWSETGVLTEESEFLNGVRNGRHFILETQDSCFLKSSQCIAEYTYENGLLHGPFIKRHSNGKIWLRGENHQGKIHGLLSEYNDDGFRVFKTKYAYGEEIWSRLAFGA
jgi:hypothetical protein